MCTICHSILYPVEPCIDFNYSEVYKDVRLDASRVIRKCKLLCRFYVLITFGSKTIDLIYKVQG